MSGDSSAQGAQGSRGAINPVSPGANGGTPAQLFSSQPTVPGKAMFSNELFNSSPNPYTAPPMIRQPTGVAPATAAAPGSAQEIMARIRAGGHK